MDQVAPTKRDGGTELSGIGFEFSRKDVEELAEKLSKVALDDRERGILLAIFWAARDHVSQAVKGPESPLPTGTGLKQQIVDLFIPGEGADYYFSQPLMVGRIGSDPPPPKPRPVPQPPPPPKH